MSSRSEFIRMPVVASLVLVASVELRADPGFLKRIDSQADLDSINYGSRLILYNVPGPDPATVGPGLDPVPGPVERPCMTFVMYGPPVQHYNVIMATQLPCLADFTIPDLGQMREAMTLFSGYIDKFTSGGQDLYAVTVHNDQYEGPPEIEPHHLSYVMHQLKLTFNEAGLGRLVYVVTTDRARARLAAWRADPSVTLDFDIYPPVQRRFIRGDVNQDGFVDITDAVAILRYLYIDSTTPIPCLDSADTTDDGAIDLHDPMRILRYFYLGGVQGPAPPFPDRGYDWTPDDWECRP